MFMKLYFKFLVFVFIFSFCALASANANKIIASYDVGVGKLNLGKMGWEVNMNQNDYKIIVSLRDGGLLSAFYSFEGDYVVVGKIENGFFFPKNYKQFWSTKKKTRNIEIVFENDFVKKLYLFPEEEEFARIDYFALKNFHDPLSSFLNIILKKNSSYTMDGRRVYTMKVDETVKKNELVSKKILIEDFKNIWADHKRKGLEYIEIVQNDSGIELSLPLIIKIKYKGILYTLKKN